MTITYLDGDATQPVGDGKKILTHICNDGCRWGRGFVLAVTQRYPEAEVVYRRAGPATLGTCQVVDIIDTDEKSEFKPITVINMIAQHGIHWAGDTPPIRYDALRECLAQVREEAIKRAASVHMPRIGSGLAGGDWDTIERIIEVELQDIDVTVYNFREKGAPWYVEQKK